MKTFVILAAALALASFSASPALAWGGGHGAAHAPKGGVHPKGSSKAPGKGGGRTVGGHADMP